MHVYACVCMLQQMCGDQRMLAILSFHCVGFGAQTQVIRLDSKHLYLLNQLTDPSHLLKICIRGNTASLTNGLRKSDFSM